MFYLLKTLDSLLTDTLITKVESLFQNHLLTPTHHQAILRASNTQYWVAILLVLIFSIFVFAKVSDPKKLFKVFHSSFSLQAAKQLYREDYQIIKRFSLLLWFTFVLVLTFLIQGTNQYFGLIFQDYPEWQQYLFFFLIISLTIAFRYVFNSIIAFFIKQVELSNEYFFNITIFSQTIGLVLFPFVLCMYLTQYPTEWFLYPALIISLLFYLFRVMRGIIITVMEQNVGVLYIFLYLCALEILPILVLIKFLFVNF